MKERTIFIVVLLTWVLIALGFFVANDLDFLPELASTRGVLVDRLFRLLLGIATVIFLIVEGALLYAILRFRRKPGDESDAKPVHGNNTLELLWTLVPAVIVVVIGVYSFNVLTAIERPQPDPLVVEVIGRQFSWEFRYPDVDVSSPVLHLPLGKPARFEITSEDVIHSFWVPNFLAKRDATPGQVSELLITPMEIGRFPVRCAELCGPGHATMTTEVVVESQEAFDSWLQGQLGAPADGRGLFTQFGCNACHALADADAHGAVGPALDGIAELAANHVPGLDARAYLEQSILEPGAYVVEGYPDGVMPTNFGERMRDDELQVLVDYLLSQ